jgi:hypothetical protein
MKSGSLNTHAFYYISALFSKWIKIYWYTAEIDLLAVTLHYDARYQNTVDHNRNKSLNILILQNHVMLCKHGKFKYYVQKKIHSRKNKHWGSKLVHIYWLKRGGKNKSVTSAWECPPKKFTVCHGYVVENTW